MSYPAHWYFRMYPPPAATGKELLEFVEDLLDQECGGDAYEDEDRPGWVAFEERFTWYDAADDLAEASVSFPGVTLVLHAVFDDAPNQIAYYARDGRVEERSPTPWEPPEPEEVFGQDPRA